MSSKRKQFKIYGPAHFAATWKKYLEICDRDGTNASKEIRQYVRDQVTMRAPGNPQRPLTAFVDGHPDELTTRRSEILKACISRAAAGVGVVKYRFIIEELKAGGWSGYNRKEVADSLEADLKKFDVKVLH